MADIRIQSFLQIILIPILLGVGNDFTAQPGVWIGAKVGLFCINPNINKRNGFADFDWFRFE
jgi:hypothetical protein